ncbi:hypothetical protein LA080_005193 [Diaporthe eres]|nr:hypothetical protein LA080_005193 [Diaporthe eres]
MAPNFPQETPRRPKLRSSCDACGTVKLKCDRKHPQCGRCTTHGIDCTYSISRKLGKPPRDTMRKRSESLSARTGSHLANSFSTSSLNESLLSYKWDDDDNEPSHKRNGNDGSNSSHDSNNMFNFDGFLDESLASALPLSELLSLDFGTSVGSDQLDSSMPPSMRPSFTMMEEQLDLDLIGSSAGQHSSKESGMSFPGGTNHSCYQEAHEMLGSMMLTDSSWSTRRGSLEETSPGGGPYNTLCSKPHGSMTLDQLLLLNGKAVERLSSLLACPCASSPHLMMLYASTISAILSRYQSAAGSASCMPCPTWDLLAFQRVSSRVEGINNNLQLGGPMVSPARISIGAFSVDDPKLQSALNIRLLASEVMRVTGLIDQISSYHSGGSYLGGGSSGDQMDGMYQGFATWLRGEHSRVTDVIRNKLRELENHFDQNCAYFGSTLDSF